MIDADTIIRQIQLSLITDTPNQIIDWFNNLWDNIDVVPVKKFQEYTGECIYYTKDNKRPVFYMDNTNGHVLYDYNHYSNYFYGNAEFDYISPTKLEDISLLLLSMVIDHKDLCVMQGHLTSITEINVGLYGV